MFEDGSVIDIELDEIELEILSALRDAGDAPLGSVTLSLQLNERLDVGQATIGRKLKEFDMRGLTERMGYRGRRLTQEGHEYLKRMINAFVTVRRNEAFLRSLDTSDGQELIQILEARRALERETARLAALRMNESEIETLEELIRNQQKAIDSGEPGTHENLAFHEAISHGARNEVLTHALRLIRGQSQLLLLIGSIRERVGGVLVHDHKEILAALRTGDPLEAEEAMANHIDRIIADVVQYFGLAEEQPRDSGNFSAEIE